MDLLINFTVLLCAYLFGSLSSAIITCKLMGLSDPRTQGSGNPGATNVLRIGGKVPALLTLFGDSLKGLVPVLVAKWLGFDLLWLGLIGTAAFMGHLFPIFFQFAGGKGVATFIGVLIAIAWPVAIAWLLAWLAIYIILRYVSLASIIASLLAPFFLYYWYRSLALTGICTLMSLILLARHHENIQRLWQGREKKLR